MEHPASAPQAQRLSRMADAVLLSLATLLAAAALYVAWAARGIVPDYDAVQYLHEALRLRWHLDGTLAAPQVLAWIAALPVTNTLDTLAVALLHGSLDDSLAVWLLHTGYLAAFALLLRRVLGAPLALFVLAWAATQGQFLHQYTSFISEMKVGLFLALFIAVLFHRDARGHPAILFACVLALLALRTLDLVFVIALTAAFVAARRIEGRARIEVHAVLKPIALALAAATPLLAIEVPRAIAYVINTAQGSVQNWRDMSGVHDKAGLVMAYVRGLTTYNLVFQVLCLAAFAFALATLFTRGRARLAALRDPAAGVLVACAVLMLASTTNLQVVFWPFALEGLLMALLAQAMLRPAHVLVAACVLAAGAAFQTAGNLAAWQRDAVRQAPLQRFTAELVHSLDGIEAPVVFENFGGYGPLDWQGLELAAGRPIGMPAIDPIGYNAGLPHYLAGLEPANVAFVANRNFLWPAYWGINAHTQELAREVQARAAASGWTKVRRIELDGDPTRYVDVYRRGRSPG